MILSCYLSLPPCNTHDVERLLGAIKSRRDTAHTFLRSSSHKAAKSRVGLTTGQTCSAICAAIIDSRTSRPVTCLECELIAMIIPLCNPVRMSQSVYFLIEEARLFLSSVRFSRSSCTRLANN